jgi:protoporphyrinogen oxidase
MPTSEISADWAAQRIKGLSLVNAVTSVLFKRFQKPGKGSVIKTLIDEFHYPKLGPGQMWEAARDHVRKGGNQVAMDSRVVAIEHDEARVQAFVSRDSNGNETRHTGRNFISTLPLRNLIQSMNPPAPVEVQEAANSLKYRDFLTVVLIADQPKTFPDTWVYVHDPEVRLGRVQNFKNWSPYLVPDQSKSSLGLEYFCFEGDGLWSMSDTDLIALGTKEIGEIGLVDPTKVVDGCVVRMPKAYPVYDDEYQRNVEIIRQWLAKLENLQVAGRNGMHKYNNQDHSMMTALLTARNIMGQGPYDPWCVNTDAEYHEEKAQDQNAADTAGRAVPRKLAANV